VPVYSDLEYRQAVELAYESTDKPKSRGRPRHDINASDLTKLQHAAQRYHSADGKKPKQQIVHSVVGELGGAWTYAKVKSWIDKSIREMPLLESEGTTDEEMQK